MLNQIFLSNAFYSYRLIAMPFSTLTFRFPRVEKIREDKDCNDCMTITDLEALKARGMAKRYLHDDDDDDTNGDSTQQQTKRRKVINVKHASVDPIYQPSYKSSEIRTASKNLSGKVFVVEKSVAEPKLKAKLEKIILEHSGVVEQNVKVGITWAFIQTNLTKTTSRVKNAIDADAFNVIKCTWLLNCDDGKFTPLR